MRHTKVFFIAFFTIYIGIVNAQKRFTLEECIAIALENNLDLKNVELLKNSSKVNYKQSLNQLLPNLNANYNLGVNDGRSIDPFTNSYINQELTFSNLGVNLNTTIFNGFRILNSIKQNKFNLRASEMEVEEARQNLKLQVTLGYIQILNNADLIELSKSRLKSTESQLKRLKRLYEQESGNPSNYTDMQGQYATDKIGIINSENNYKSAILNLLSLLNLDDISEKEFDNISGLIEANKYQFSAVEVYNEALNNLATFKSRQYRIEASKSGVKAARSNYVPEVSLFGQLNTNYSSLAEVFTETGNTVIETGNYVSIDNQDYPVLKNETQFSGSKISYEDQFENNLNTVVGVAVRVPLFNGFRAKNEVKLQKIQLERNKTELESTKLLFKQSIEEAYNSMDTAYNRYHLLVEQVTAYEESYRIQEIRFNNGVSNIVDYITAKNNLDSSRINLNNAKYEYLLRVKILDFYRGV